MVMKKQETIYGTAKEISVPKTNLLRHFKSLKELGLTSFEHKQNSDVKSMFKDAEELHLVEYIIKTSQL